MKTENEFLNQKFCLFHQQIGCPCIYPVANTGILIKRLKNEISINNILNKYEKDEKVKHQLDQEIVLYENRLSDLKDSH